MSNQKSLSKQTLHEKEARNQKLFYIIFRSSVKAKLTTLIQRPRFTKLTRMLSNSGKAKVTACNQNIAQNSHLLLAIKTLSQLFAVHTNQIHCMQSKAKHTACSQNSAQNLN